MFFFFFLGPPLPRGVPGEGPDCHFPKEIIGVALACSAADGAPHSRLRLSGLTTLPEGPRRGPGGAFRFLGTSKSDFADSDGFVAVF